jgi:putative inorganic carbon (hco3(-)) transporter
VQLDKLKILYAAGIGFILLNVIFIASEIFWFMALPMALTILLLFFFSLDKLILIIVFLTPLSFEYSHGSMGFAIVMPTEPLIVAIMCLFFLKLIYEQEYDKNIAKHPITIILIIQIFWMLITTLTSEIPLVSFKYFLSRLWFVVTFYFVAIRMFKRTENIRLFIWLFGASLTLAVIYVIVHHSMYDFERQIGTWIVWPFFNDHTHYSAVIAFIAPLFIIMTFYGGYSALRRRISLIIFIILVTGVFFSYSRASWLSIAVAFGAFWILVLKINYKFILAGLLLFAGILYTFQNDLVMSLERNRQDSSEDVREHVQSISNISSDASNLERINRWRAAYRLYQERPILGWGPGTYQEVYAPYQLSVDRTIITTNFGDMGNAHSEYLGPLAESGLPGMIIILVLAVFVFIRGIKNYWNAPLKELRWISLGITLGFITYFTHGFLNNFLDTDEASVLFWGFLAILVAIDVYHIPKTKESPEKKSIA